METIREKVLRAWQDKVKIEVRHGEDILTGRVISYCVDSFIFQTDGKALRFGYEAVSEISFFSEPAERITPDVAKERWKVVTCDRERFIEYGDGDGLCTISNISDLYAGRPDQIAVMVAAPEMLDALECTVGLYGNTGNRLDRETLEKCVDAIEKARGGE